MQVIKSRDDSGLIVELKEGNDRLKIHFARNLDLYWIVSDGNINNTELFYRSCL